MITETIAHELSNAYLRGALSPVEVVQAVLEQAERERALNAFVLLDAESALEAARASERRLRARTPLGLLEGIPVSVKDLLLVKGWPTRRGSLTTSAEANQEVDSPAAARLREHGAIILGKTTTSEFGLKGLGDSPLTGITRNPWSHAHTPGGSSAGAVAAVAAGMGPLAVATDGGGSIRIPSALTGVVGLKPTFGRVPTWPSAVVGAPAHVGPVGRTVVDVALLLSVLAGNDERDPFRLPPSSIAYHEQLHAPLSGVRIGASATFGFAEVDRHVLAAFARAVNVFRELGADVVERDPGFSPVNELLRTLFLGRAANTVRSLGPAQRELLDPAIAEAAREGEALSAVDYLAAEEARTALADQSIAYHREFDLLITPTTAAVAPRVDGSRATVESPRELSPFAAPFSLTRQPAISVPAGIHPSGLPMGLQIVGRHFDEALVLRAAAQYERAVGGFARPARA